MVRRDLAYATVDGLELCLDLHLPVADDAPLVLYAHGGGFMQGDKADSEKERIGALAELGLAVASVNYRLVPDGTFPDQIFDLKGAVRWLRAHGAEYGLNAEKIGVWGASAGAYLTTMVALTEGDPEFEGDVGGNSDESSAVHAAVSWFGPSDLVSSGRRSPLEQQILFPPFEAAVLGVSSLTEAGEIGRRASALSRVTADAPPFLIAHGDSDRVVAPSESVALHSALGRVGVSSTLTLLSGAGHEDPAFHQPANLALTAAWLRSVLRP